MSLLCLVGTAALFGTGRDGTVPADVYPSTIAYLQPVCLSVEFVYSQEVQLWDYGASTLTSHDGL